MEISSKQNEQRQQRWFGEFDNESVLWQTPTLHSDRTIPKFPEDCGRETRTAASCPHPCLIPRTSECGTLHGEGDFADVIKLRILRWESLSWIILEGPVQSQGSFLSQRGRQETWKPRSRDQSDTVAGRGP